MQSFSQINFIHLHSSSPQIIQTPQPTKSLQTSPMGGCSPSNLASGHAAAHCRLRSDLLAALIHHRFALSSSYAAYAHSLRSLSAALHPFLAAQSHPKPSTLPITSAAAADAAAKPQIDIHCLRPQPPPPSVPCQQPPERSETVELGFSSDSDRYLNLAPPSEALDGDSLVFLSPSTSSTWDFLDPFAFYPIFMLRLIPVGALSGSELGKIILVSRRLRRRLLRSLKVAGLSNNSSTVGRRSGGGDHLGLHCEGDELKNGKKREEEKRVREKGGRVMVRGKERKKRVREKKRGKRNRNKK